MMTEEKNKYEYRYFPKFVMRTPLMPVNFAKELLKGDQVDENQLKKVFELPEVKEAVFLASPELKGQLDRFLSGDEMKQKDVFKLKLSLFSYLMRMSFRCTPFGMFAGFSLGEWGDKTDVCLPHHNKCRKHTRLDMDVLCSLALDLAKDPFLRKKILWYPNTSAYPAGEQLRYVEFTYEKNRRNHHIVAVDHSIYLKRVLDLCDNGALLDQMAECLVDDEITREEAEGFINELIDNQVVVSELDPAITGPEFINQMINSLEKVPELKEYTKLLHLTLDKLKEVDEQDLGVDIKEYEGISEAFQKTGTKFEEKYFYQVDMVKYPLSSLLDHKIADRCLETLDILNRLSIKRPETSLDNFISKFEGRYETKTMPLLTVLDTEMGVGYGSAGDQGDITPLVDDIVTTPKPQSVERIYWNRRIMTVLLKLYTKGVKSPDFEVEITDEDVKDLDVEWGDLPLTSSSMLRVYGKQGDDYLLGMSHMSNSSAANLLGRFCHADEPTYDFVKDIIKQEEAMDPERIYAEIIHLPEKRTGNILLRPLLRKYEIPFLAKAAVDEEYQLSLRDLYLMKKRGRLVLWSKSLNKEIVPRLSTAHNYSNNALPIYQFLCDLQTQDMRGAIGFNWGVIDNIGAAYPRVRYKNVIISPAQWNLMKPEYEDIMKEKDEAKMVDKFKVLQKEIGFPDKVYLADSDNELFLDLTNTMSIHTLFSRVKNRETFTLKEYLFDDEHAIVNSTEGSFTNEVIVSYYRHEVSES